MRLRRIHPDPAELTAAEAISGLGLGELGPGGRPYVVANMISSADGKASFEGRTRQLGDEVDRALFHRLRTQVDAVLVGSGTLRAERYGRLVSDPELRAAREAEGRAGDPLGCVVTRSLDVPFDLPLFQEPEQPTVVFTSSQEPLEGAGPGVTVERLRAEELTMTSVLEVLRARHDVRSVLCEGGPTVLGLMLGERVVDELFLSVAPRIAGGGEAPTIVEGTPLSELVDLELVWALEAEGSLFLRYRVVNS
jgi:riboflavin-specific deaminase-like protein